MRKRAVLLAAVLLAVLYPKGAWAEVQDESQNSVIVGPTSSGPVVRQGSAGFDSGGIQASAASQGQQFAAPQPVASSATGPPTEASAPASLTAPTSTPPCGTPQQGVSYSPVTDAAGQPLIMTANGAPSSCPPAPSHSPPPATLPPNPTPQQLAEAASAKQPWPNLVVGINPGTGLTGLASWFWLGGGSPQIPDATASAGGLTVKVRATLVDVHWEFGDWSTYDSGPDLGQAYPAQSDVQHVYQTDGSVRVSVSLVFSVEYAVGDGPWQPLGTKSKAYTRPYSVNQLQPQAVSS
jgi:hypothetical protein